MDYGYHMAFRMKTKTKSVCQDKENTAERSKTYPNIA